jgi:hypothetical protein
MNGNTTVATAYTVKQEQQRMEELARTATLASATVMFHTNDDDKDCDTMLTMHILKGVRALARTSQPIFGRFPDHTDNGPFGLSPVGAVSKEDLVNASFSVHIAPRGHDAWRFNTSLDLAFTDNTHKIYTWTGQVVDQANPDAVHQL